MDLPDHPDPAQRPQPESHLAPQVLEGDLAELAAVGAAAAVVTEHEIMPVRDLEFTIHPAAGRRNEDVVPIVVESFGKQVRASVAGSGAQSNVGAPGRTFNRFAIDVDLLMAVADAIPGQTDYPLDEGRGRVKRIPKYNDVAAFG